MIKELEKNIKELENSKMQETENGALAYSTSGRKLLDMNFKVASYRSMPEEDLVKDFTQAMSEDKILAAKFMFFLRDVRGGLGERRSFRVFLKTFVENNTFKNNVLYDFLFQISEYGRWDDLIWLYDNITDKITKSIIIQIIKDQIHDDIKRMSYGYSVSLLAKWMPRVNTSSKETKRIARNLAKDLALNERAYRKTIAGLNKYIDTVEVKMSANDWENIDYEKVASKANILYKDAFSKHDPKGRQQYLDKLEAGESKINASVAYPYDIIHSYCAGNLYRIAGIKDVTLEEMWKSLPNYVDGDESTLVVCDSSASMTIRVGGGSVSAREVAYSLAIYFAERANGEFKDKFITFSEDPKFIDISKGTDLRTKFNIAVEHSEVSNTNIEKTMLLVLDTAIKNHMKQNELPGNILIISDMEFDQGTFSWKHQNELSRSLFDEISNKFKEYGYKMPRIVFWNVNSRTCGVPIKENELGVALVSGFSPSICQMVLSSELDPWKCLLNVLNSERYYPIQRSLEMN